MSIPAKGNLLLSSVLTLLPSLHNQITERLTCYFTEGKQDKCAHGHAGCCSCFLDSLLLFRACPNPYGLRLRIPHIGLASQAITSCAYNTRTFLRCQALRYLASRAQIAFSDMGNPYPISLAKSDRYLGPGAFVVQG